MLSMPQRGQAISYNDLYNIVDNINNINSQLVSSTNTSYVLGPNGDTATPKTSQSLFSATYFQIPSQKITAVGQKKDFVIPLGGVNFKSPPIVTVTVQAGSGADGTSVTAASYNVTAVVTKISTTTVSVTVIYNTVGTTTNALHVIAIGQSN